MRTTKNNMWKCDFHSYHPVGINSITFIERKCWFHDPTYITQDRNFCGVQLLSILESSRCELICAHKQMHSDCGLLLSTSHGSFPPPPRCLWSAGLCCCPIKTAASPLRIGFCSISFQRLQILLRTTICWVSHQFASMLHGNSVSQDRVRPGKSLLHNKHLQNSRCLILCHLFLIHITDWCRTWDSS